MSQEEIKEVEPSEDEVVGATGSGSSAGMANAHAMLMGAGSSSFVRTPVSTWQNVARVDGGRDILLAECFRAMQRYQTRALRLQLRLDNLTRGMGSNQSSSSHPGSFRDSSVARSTSDKEFDRKPARVDEIDEVGLQSHVLDLEDQLQAEKQKVFEVTAQLKSLKVVTRANRKRNKEYISEFLKHLGEDNEQKAGQHDATIELKGEQVKNLRDVLRQMYSVCESDEKDDDDDTTKSGGEEDWRPYVLQAHPGTASPEVTSPFQQGNGKER